MNVYELVIDTVPPDIVVENAVRVLVVVAEVTVLAVVTPVSVVVSTKVTRLAEVLVDKIDVKVVVVDPAVGPVTV